jgi:hypothetical protein
MKSLIIRCFVDGDVQDATDAWFFCIPRSKEIIEQAKKRCALVDKIEAEDDHLHNVDYYFFFDAVDSTIYDIMEQDEDAEEEKHEYVDVSEEDLEKHRSSMWHLRGWTMIVRPGRKFSFEAFDKHGGQTFWTGNVTLEEFEKGVVDDSEKGES